MDKNAIKKYAVWARRELISRVSQKAAFYGITDTDHGTVGAESVDGRVLTAAEKKQRDALIRQIQKDGYEQTIEEVAYTWFNRFSALRYMEVNGYLPTHVRVFTDDTGALKPQILTEAINLELDGLDMQKVYDLKNSNQDEALYRYLLITQCNALNAILPGMFQKIEDYTELLLPDNLLREGSVIEQMVTTIPEEDWTDQVQIIGWMYQYYNAEKKDDVFAALKKNVKITKENIPAATQLFTPDWIVRYMVENSLGRIFVSEQLSVGSGQLAVVSGQWAEAEQERILKEKAIAEQMGWKYYLPEAEQTPEVRAKLNALTTDHLSLDTLRVIDPCMGSGHILVYMFDVLVKIYEEYGYSARDAVKSIVENNLYGLDIDDRAAQLAYFAVMMKARQYDRRFFSCSLQPHVYAIVESNHVDKFAVEYFCNGDEKLTAAMDTIIGELHDAKEYGSILNVTPQDWSALYARFAEIEEEISISREAALNELLPLVQVAEALAQKYDVVVTNPPYMGASNMNPKLSDFIKKNYADYKSDFFSAFVIHCSEMTKKSGYCGFFTPYVWMFIQSYEKMRNYLYTQATIETLIQFEYSAFEEATVPVCTFAFQNRYVQKKGCYLRLVDFRGGMEVQRQKTLEAIGNHNCGFYYEQSADNFSKISGSPVAYWINDSLFKDYDAGKQLGSIFDVKKGMTTADNNRFLRFWFEVDKKQLYKKWYKTHKGGEFRKWYGNDENVVNWQDSGRELKAFSGSVIRNEDYYFRRCITWNDISSSRTGFRYIEGNSISNASGPSVYDDSNGLLYALGLCNSKVVEYIFALTCPTIHFEVGRVAELPVLAGCENSVIELVESSIALSKMDWDSFETSWDFQHHPLVSGQQSVDSDQKTDHCSLISDHYKAWEHACEDRFQQLKKNEEELNRIFIDIYGLQDELTPEVAERDITVHRVYDSKDDVPESMRGSNYVRTMRDEIVSLISYAVGCMFGRYSLDVDGLAYAGGFFSDQWAAVSGQYYKREVVEYYVGKELSRALGMAEIHVGCGGDLPSGEAASERGAVCLIGPDAAGSSVDPFQYRRGTSKKLYEGICTLSLHSKGVNGGAGDTIYDLCSPEILAAISNRNGDELVKRGWQNAERIDWKTIHCTLTTNHFSPDKDNIIPICDDEYFDDDIVGRFVEFVKTVYGEDTLDENLKFIADALGGKGQPKDVIRNYFLNDFYADHCKIYQKRPIYWLFDSGKKNGFKALIYMHRYREDTIARIRTDYVHEQQGRYRTAMADLESRIANADTGSRVKLTKQLTKLRDQAEELRVYEEKIHHLADQMIRIDLDDGVKHNYEIFKDVLAKIK